MVRLPAYILAGGESRRYGQDKTLLSWDGEPLILRTVRTAQKVASDVKIVARERDKFEFVGIPVLLDVVERCGPLGGLLTALEDCHAEQCLVLASDMPYLTEEWLSELFDIWEDAPIIFSQSSKGIEPLCAIYSKATLPFWWEQYRNKNFSLQKGIQQLGGVQVEFKNELESHPPFFNLNEPNELP
ncbi:molybdenum cofactor guanylyltransferase [bacterium]|nr:molybdenum cofactor guanylyltransferase [bacterium]